MFLLDVCDWFFVCFVGEKTEFLISEAFVAVFVQIRRINKVVCEDHFVGNFFDTSYCTLMLRLYSICRGQLKTQMSVLMLRCSLSIEEEVMHTDLLSFSEELNAVGPLYILVNGKLALKVSKTQQKLNRFAFYSQRLTFCLKLVYDGFYYYSRITEEWQ